MAATGAFLFNHWRKTVSVFPHDTYDREFPEAAPVQWLDHYRIQCVARVIADNIRRDLTTESRVLTPGLRSALRSVIDADREEAEA